MTTPREVVELELEGEVVATGDAYRLPGEALVAAFPG
jgi:hypothetical protein